MMLLSLSFPLGPQWLHHPDRSSSRGSTRRSLGDVSQGRSSKGTPPSNDSFSVSNKNNNNTSPSGYYQTITMVIGAKLPKPSPRAEARATSLGDTSFL